MAEKLTIEEIKKCINERTKGSYEYNAELNCPLHFNAKQIAEQYIELIEEIKKLSGPQDATGIMIFRLLNELGIE